MKRWFLPEMPDVLGALGEQMRVTIEGMDAFERWSGGEPASGQAVREREHAADEARRAVQGALRQAFATTIGPEDVYELSERLDAILNGAKNIVREADLLAAEPDAAMAEMARSVRAGVGALASAFSALGARSGADEATAAADVAIKGQRGLERTYRDAMSALLEVDDLRAVTAKRELYRRYARLGDAVEAVAHRVWYAVVKQG
jgi:uncharacterized protein Yka (UPF0111/DUF47 family)